MVDSLDNYNLTPPDQNRFRFGIVILVMGIILVLWAWGSWIYRSSSTAPPGSSINRSFEYDENLEEVNARSEYPDQTQVAKTLPTMLLYGFILFMVVLAATFILVRATRRYLAAAAHKRAPPTETSDVWSTHKLPDDYEN